MATRLELLEEFPKEEVVHTEDGGWHHIDNTVRCDDCGTRYYDSININNDYLCRACADEAELEREHIAELRSDYYWGQI